MPFVYPTSFVIDEIQPELVARSAAGRLGLGILPTRDVNVAKVRWNQHDNYYGLQNMRGLDGAPTRVVRTGRKTYEYEPAVFGEYVDLTETELTTRAGEMDVNTQPIDIGDMIAEADDHLIGREFDRVESSIWTLLTTGTISIKIDGPNGTQFAWSDSYTFQQYVAPISWSTLSTAVPIRNFQSVQQLGQAAGHSVDFGAGATAYMTQVTANLLLNNQNAADLNGRRNGSGATINDLAAVQSYWTSQNLPKIQVYDQGYIPLLGGKFQRYIPDNKIVVIGQRPGGVKVGEYLKTRNAANGFKPGSYRKVFDRANGSASQGAVAENRIPANIEVHRGHNGGPVIYYPSAVLVMSV